MLDKANQNNGFAKALQRATLELEAKTGSSDELTWEAKKTFAFSCCNLAWHRFLSRRKCYPLFLFPKANKMKLEDLSLLRDQGLTKDGSEKLKIVLAFYERLPSKAMKQELLLLIEHQPLMSPGEFDSQLDDFAARVKTADAFAQVGSLLPGAVSLRVH